MNIFVGSLAFAATENDLKEFFEGCGEVTSVKIITDRETGRSKGFGFVEMADKAEGQNAVDTLNGKDLAGRAIVVNEARPREERPKRSFGDRPRRSFGDRDSSSSRSGGGGYNGGNRGGRSY
jgi:RNA recognition motif-containing protein